MATQEIAVKIRSQTDEVSIGSVQLEIWDQKERMRRALKLLALLWGIGIFCVILPLVHFFLVPSFLIAGPIAASIVYAKDRMILGGKGLCPHCKQDLPIAKTQDQWPISDLCTVCQSALSIEKV
ncbi:MAG: hypothetical protein H7222_11225 [Methylotenera sp.]|nr:hypothetical protein [Oligoflexia bacterium]